MQLAIHADLAHAASDQLGVLGTEVEDQDAVGVNVLVSHELSFGKSLKLKAGSWKPKPGFLPAPAASFRRLSS